MKRAAFLISAFTIVVLLYAGGPAAADSAPVMQVRAAIDQASPVFADKQLPPAEKDKRLSTIAEKYFESFRQSRLTCWRPT